MEAMVTPSRTPFSPFLSSQLKPIPKPTLHLHSPIPSPPPKDATATATTFTLQQTKEIHGHIIRTQFRPTNILPAQSSPQAQLNFLITSYIKNNTPSAALNLYARMRETAASPDNFTVPSVLKACAQLSSLRQGMEIHGFVIKAGFHWDVFVHNSLMQMYSECGSLGFATKLFDEMPDRDVVSWSTMIRSYAWCKLFDEAIELVREMLRSGIRPSEVAIINMLNLFADVGEFTKGRPVHTYLIKNSARESPSVNATTALIDMYVKCGSISAARRVFDRMEEKSTASWAAMIAGFIRSRDMGTAMELLIEMRHNHVFPNEITMLSLVIECGSIGNLELGKWLHAYILRNGFKMSVALGTALVDMYCKCRDLWSAREMFDLMDGKDIAVWTAMIAGYAHTNCIKEAFDLFTQMKDANIKPNEITMVNLLSLCSEAGALDRGRWIHACIDKQGIEMNVVLTTSLVDMYAKCGDINAAYAVFTQTTDRDVCMWNAMINGLAMNGYGEETISLFMEMEKVGVRPNNVTFIGVLRACSHSGLVEEGKQFFSCMEHDYGLVPKVEHYGCMVDLLGRAGHLVEAHELIRRMPNEPNVIIWGALLAACKVHKNPKLGELAAKELLKLEPHSSGYNILLSNIYAIDRRWSEVAEVRKSMKDTGIKKMPGMTAIEVNGVVHEFVMGDASHPQSKKIQAMLSEMQEKLKRAGHVADTSGVYLNIDEEEKETVLNYHSEKLAMAFGLISTPPRTPIRIVKNLRVCDDCHAATKLLTQIYGRVIIVRDRNRFHRFCEGSCSCQDYW
ncbi:unnamed protein product [Musa acuminata subsp. malaccensis]|uniref:(wild Malaysian banana) hypothetical protein n=1 Tax=Musa acuminata subsp. malaccensis TaxID=214687 RepID=A0A804L885_MUSAM|nr:PREDICTED: pentatricopeptide repeat-containing protein At4g21065-like [Musa acuminata subsp. malaccensis]CAG1864690.1 unnamed protein product [Musa acuminata subsp. malaccensis]